MLIKRFSECPEIAAGDQTLLRELLHPERDQAAVRYSLAVARVKVGERSLAHRLKTTEVYYVVAGEGRMHVGEEEAAVGPGDVVYVPAGAAQWIENTGNRELEFACIVDPAWRARDESLAGNDEPGAPGSS
jgi:mannose-6-phosphate isomerase-like protein (cupin superfamily)